MKLVNTLTGERLCVVRMANQYEYVIKEIGTRNKLRMNHEQFAAYLRKAEIKVEEEV
jgi:UDP-N-acetylmuramyl pentapeptide synthase